MYNVYEFFYELDLVHIKSCVRLLRFSEGCALVLVTEIVFGDVRLFIKKNSYGRFATGRC